MNDELIPSSPDEGYLQACFIVLAHFDGRFAPFKTLPLSSTDVMRTHHTRRQQSLDILCPTCLIVIYIVLRVKIAHNVASCQSPRCIWADHRGRTRESYQGLHILFVN